MDRSEGCSNEYFERSETWHGRPGALSAVSATACPKGGPAGVVEDGAELSDTASVSVAAYDQRRVG